MISKEIKFMEKQLALNKTIKRLLVLTKYVIRGTATHTHKKKTEYILHVFCKIFAGAVFKLRIFNTKCICLSLAHLMIRGEKKTFTR